VLPPFTREISLNNAVLEPPDLTACDREPIHAPGSIQPHGMMLITDSANLTISHVAGDVEGRLGVSAWIGVPLQTLLGRELVSDLAAIIADGGRGGFVGQLLALSGETLDVTASLSGPYVLVELEAASKGRLSPSGVMDRVAASASRFALASSMADLCDRAVTEFRRLTGFDRVMAYRFRDDDSGEVLAEDRRDGLHSFLNHLFPASDIPQQARALYVRNVFRVIPNSSYEPADLRPSWKASAALDMADSGLRSVSPIHLLYLRNMGVRASASFSIVVDGHLWGLIACHHSEVREIPYDLRAACHILVDSLSRQIKAKEEAEGLRQRIRLRGFEDDIVALLSRTGTLSADLSNHLDEISRMMGAEGIVVLRGRELVTGGNCPAEPEIRDLAAWLAGRSIEPVFSTDRLSQLYPAAAVFKANCSGLLLVTLSAEEPWLLMWFRAEQVEVVKWAGNPHKEAAPEPAVALTPRASFDSWAETVSGRSRRWSLPELEAAARLRLALLEVRQNVRTRDLNFQLTSILRDKDLLLKQKEFLVGEVNHRVQNSLQLVSSFLALQSRSSQDQGLKDALEEARRRLTAVALVHRRLHRGDQVEVVDAARYIEELCADTFSFMGGEWSRHITLNVAPVLLPTDRAVTIGLILTELLINANKHAYDGAPGPIAVDLTEDRTHLRLSVSDRGAGVISPKEGFGSRIMAGLVAQMHGELTRIDNQPGLRITVSVPLDGK
jgi:chemotaxis family two-component system sensor kinase Cph1